MGKVLAGQQQQPPAERAGAKFTYVDDGALDAAQRASRRFAERLYNAFYRATHHIVAAWRSPYGGPPPYTADRQKLWLKFAKKLQSRGIGDPEAYINQLFELGDTLQPSQVVAEQAMATYERRLETSREQQQRGWHTACNEFNVHARIIARANPTWSIARVQRAVLSNLAYDLPPLFRYCIAAHSNFEDLTADFYDQALRQLLTDPGGYATTWQGRIPVTLLNAAARMLGTLPESEDTNV